MSHQIKSKTYCNNCGKYGHVYHSCKSPITSYGCITYRINPIKNRIEYLLICRKNTLGYIDFMRGKYSPRVLYYIMNMIKQMTIAEKEGLLCKSFATLWKELWGETVVSSRYKYEESNSRNNFLQIAISRDDFTNDKTIHANNLYVQQGSILWNMVYQSLQDNYQWNEPEWGFPKGRRNNMEKDYDCAIREFTEETGINTMALHPVTNISPFYETFIGSNYKMYKHKYYLCNIDYYESLKYINCFEKGEVSKMEWNTFEDCLVRIRDYNYEKKKIISNVNQCLETYIVVQ